MSKSQTTFLRDLLEAKALPLDDAERRLRELHVNAIAERRYADARSCLTQLSIYLAEQGKTRECLHVCIRLARDEGSAFYVACVAYALERHGWLGFAETLFARILELPEEPGDEQFKLREEARDCLERLRVRKGQRRES
jgi:hypothetical protein